MNNLPKPAVIGAAILLIALALFVVFRSVKSGGANDAYGSAADIKRQEEAGRGKPREANQGSHPMHGSPNH